MADWDSSNPLDNSIVAQFPANERSARGALVTNFGIDHHETDDSDVGKHKKVTLLVQGSDPTAAAGQGVAYTKSVSGVVEVFHRDSAGNITQLTDVGRVKGQLKPQVVTASPTTMKQGDMILIDASGGAKTLNLPASPSVGNEPISVTQVAGSASAVTIGRNGKLIMGVAEDLVLDIANASVVFYWSGDTYGWRLGIIG